jgi:hypothetical protein
VKTAVLCQPAMPLKSLPEAVFRIPQSHEKRIGFGIPKPDIDRSLFALKTDPSKRIFGFRYFNDTLAPMDKFTWLHEKLEEQHLGHKFKPVILVPKLTQKTWYEEMETTVEGGWTGPHVTLTGAEEPDRERLRELFNKMIRP